MQKYWGGQNHQKISKKVPGFEVREKFFIIRRFKKSTFLDLEFGGWFRKGSSKKTCSFFEFDYYLTFACITFLFVHEIK